MIQNYLDTPLFQIPKKDLPPTDFTIRDAVEGLAVFGSTGSGKSSGSARKILGRFLRQGFGGLVLTVKPDEKDQWLHYCSETNRLHDLIIVEPGNKQVFNFLDYLSNTQQTGTSITQNIVQVLKTVISASEEKSGGKADDPFWESALDMLIFSVIDLCKLAYGKVSIRLMFDIVTSCPKPEQNSIDKKEHKEDTPFERAFNAMRKKVMPQFETWKSTFTQDELLSMDADGTFNERLFEDVPDARIMAFVDQFFTETFANLNDKTRSIIEFSFSAFLFKLLQEPFHSLFCHRQSTFRPEDSISGKIILLNLPVKEYNEIGRDIQIMFKYIWQRAIERRKIQDDSPALFLWADEAQNFLHNYDSQYQATARSSRVATVYISQNLPNYHANMGGLKSDYRVKSFLGTLATKIFHANGDVDTNQYASQLIGADYIIDESRGASMSGQFSASVNRSLRLEPLVRPEEFASMRTGGPRNNFKCDAILHRQGNKFPDGYNYANIVFNQLSEL